mmetsp:Transcript_36106/g.66186  ORF Transcript_36106/g.66186 Transcript_36106/m.66186 type:complete len:106 (+) Transcript_36106:514-831(+)
MAAVAVARVVELGVGLVLEVLGGGGLLSRSGCYLSHTTSSAIFNISLALDVCGGEGSTAEPAPFSRQVIMAHVNQIALFYGIRRGQLSSSHLSRRSAVAFRGVPG